MLKGSAPRLSAGRLVMVVLVREDGGAGGSMPTYSLHQLPRVTTRAHAAGITAVKVFATDRRDTLGTRAAAHDSVMTRAIRIIKLTCPSVEVMTETCLCAYISTCECHLTGRTGQPDQAATIAALARQAVTQARAGADVIGPAAMIPGSIAVCRSTLDAAGFDQVRIMPHLIVNSRLYGGYRAAMGIQPRQGRPFQLSVSGHTATAVERGLRMLAEGADSLLIEPALFSTDILSGLYAKTGVPLLPFSVSGECVTLPPSLLAEEYAMLLRAGASRVVSHAALKLAATLGDTPSTVPTS